MVLRREAGWLLKKFSSSSFWISSSFEDQYLCLVFDILNIFFVKKMILGVYKVTYGGKFIKSVGKYIKFGRGEGNIKGVWKNITWKKGKWEEVSPSLK